MKTYIQITGGRGPVECARTVALVAKELQQEYPDMELVEYEAHNTEPGCFMSMTFSTNSENVAQIKVEWEGTDQWVSTKILIVLTTNERIGLLASTSSMRLLP